MPEVESWAEYRIHLIRTLERLEEAINALSKKIDMATKDGNADLSRVRDDLRGECQKLSKEIVALQIEFSMQKVRVGLLGAAAGSVPAIVAAIIWFVTR